MGKMGSFNCSGLKELQKDLKDLQDPDAFAAACARDLAARLLALVVERTHVGDYSHEVEVTAKRDSKNHKKGDVYKKRVNPSGKMGGTLRRGWISASHEEAESGKGKPQAPEILEHANGLEIIRAGNRLKVEITNPVEYASYVEFGHRTPNHKGWVRGQFMMTISEQKLQSIAPQILERKIRQYLESVMK